MSSTVLKIIPTYPVYVPDTAQQEKAEVFLRELYKDNEIVILETDTIEFIDQGENFESVSCNVCGQNIQLDDWQDQMNTAYQKQFTDLNFQTPCRHHTSLNDLNYQSSAGFAKFSISISDAQRELAKNELDMLQELLGTSLRIVWAHY